jgi:hypothetical protein
VRTVKFGFFAGSVFGVANLLVTWLDPLSDDTPTALLAFYGPMFLIWACAAFVAARRSRRILSGVMAGLTAAFATFIAFDLLILLRVNLFLHQLTGRADWQNMMMRFHASGIESLRTFVNLDYAKQVPLKLVVSCLIGSVMGVIGSFVEPLTRRRDLYIPAAR